jgi:hypothetical protein
MLQFIIEAPTVRLQAGFRAELPEAAALTGEAEASPAFVATFHALRSCTKSSHQLEQ